LIKPHGGELVNRFLNERDAEKIIEDSSQLKKIALSDYKIREVENIATGVFSPLRGFMVQKDYLSVIEKMHLQNGAVWTMPITLDLKDEIFDELKLDENILLTNSAGELYGRMVVEDKFERDKEKEVIDVFGTKELNHPGVKRVYDESNFVIGGEITLFKRLNYGIFEKYRFDPVQTREFFEQKGWKTIVAFQTRNPVHRAHEYLQKIALELYDGLFLNPLVGETKIDDLPADVRMETYEVLIDKYYPKSRVLLGVFPSNMFYAGPREAIFHAICRKNYGCTHFIVGRDHAGVGNYYGTYDSQKIFDLFDHKELEIEPLKFENAFYCTKCGSMATSRSCPHSETFHVSLSGTKMRDLLSKGEKLPEEFMRPEVSDLLIKYYSKVSAKGG
jgi:sulfate adenylyltransferase